MKCLYLDTSTSYLYVGVVSENELLGEIKDRLDNNLSTFSLYLIEKMFDKLHILPQDIDKIIVVNGPGSFTGVRIGITIAKTWAWALNIPIITISSLLAMAISCNEKKYKIPIIDARRGYYYAAIYDKDDKEVLKDCYIKREELMKEINKLKGEFCFIGSSNLEKDIIQYNPDILKIVNLVKNFQKTNPHAVNPNYLKLTEAEEKLNWK